MNECIPADELYKSIPVMNDTQLTIVACVLVPMLVVTLIFVVIFLINYNKEK